jgi:hypothetical protein
MAKRGRKKKVIIDIGQIVKLSHDVIFDDEFIPRGKKVKINDKNNEDSYRIYLEDKNKSFWVLKEDIQIL